MLLDVIPRRVRDLLVELVVRGEPCAAIGAGEGAFLE
jgi:hypothetical protein